MSRDDENWGAEDDDVVRRLRDGKPRISAFDLDRIKTTVMSRGKSSARRSAPRSRLLVAFMTVGLMVAGTAGTIAAGNSSLSSGSSAAQSQYRPPKCNPRHEECKCPSNSVQKSRDACACPAGQTFGAGQNDCFCPNGSHPNKAGECEKKHDPTSVTQTPTSSSPPPSGVTSAPAATTKAKTRAHRSVKARRFVKAKAKR